MLTTHPALTPGEHQSEHRADHATSKANKKNVLATLGADLERLKRTWVHHLDVAEV